MINFCDLTSNLHSLTQYYNLSFQSIHVNQHIINKCIDVYRHIGNDRQIECTAPDCFDYGAYGQFRRYIQNRRAFLVIITTRERCE